MSDSSQQIVQRALSGSGMTIVAQSITTILGLTRSIVLARILAPEAFGIVAFALFYVTLLASISTFGLNAALIQRDDETPASISTHFVLRMSLAALGFILTLAILPILEWAHQDMDGLVPAVAVLAGFEMVLAASSTSITLLSRRLAFKRIAIINVISSLGMTILAPSMALAGWGIWSLVLGERAFGIMVSFFAVWLYKRPWRLEFTVDRSLAREYLRFGKQVLMARQLTFLLDQFDDYWTGAALGTGALGNYNKAYEFARYPRRLIASPVSGVLFAGYARLQHETDTLARFFSRSSSLVFRANCLFSAALFMIVPEFVEWVLGPRWLPMIVAFRLLVIYSLFDPLFVVSGNLLTAVGKPQVLTRVRLWQVLFFVPAVILLASFWEINGVAVAADLMLLVGIGGVIREVKAVIPFSIKRVLTVPIAAAILACIFAFLAGDIVLASYVAQTRLFVKGVLVLAIYSVTLMLLEGREIRADMNLILRTMNFGSASKRENKSQ